MQNIYSICFYVYWIIDLHCIFCGFFCLLDEFIAISLLTNSLCFCTVLYCKPSNPPSRINTAAFSCFSCNASGSCTNWVFATLEQGCLIFIMATFTFSVSLHYIKEKDFYSSLFWHFRDEHSLGKVLVVFCTAHSYTIIWLL